jgi:hypothetical protein
MENDILRYQDRIAEVAGLSSQQLEARVLDGGFIVAKDVADVVTDLPLLANGWALKVTKRTEFRSVVNIYIIPQNKDTGRTWKRGQFKIATRAGLTRSQAFRWVASKVSIKHVLLDALALAIADPLNVQAYGEYNPEFNQTEYHTWAAVYDITDHLGPRHRATLKDLITEVIADQFPHTRT